MIQGMVYGLTIVAAGVGGLLYAGLRRPGYVLARRGSRGQVRVR